MISRGELKKLQAVRDYPSLSVLAPTHRSAPANQRDPIVVKNLVAQGLERLNAEFSKRDVSALTDNLNKLVEQVDWEHTLDGLALFANRKVAKLVYLPFKVKARAVIDETFATRDLVFALNRAPRYRVLVLTENKTHLFEARTNVLSEETIKPFPLNMKAAPRPGRSRGVPDGDLSSVRDEYHRQYFRKVDEGLAAIQKQDPLPLVIVGVDRNLSFFQEVTKDPGSIVGLVSGSYEDPRPSALGKLVWPVFQAGATLKRSQALVRLREAVSVNRHASGIAQVWRAGFEKKIQTLMVEIGYEYPANVSETGDQLLPYTAKGANALDDAVDELIETTLSEGGEVFFYEPGALDLHQSIAAVLRY